MTGGCVGFGVVTPGGGAVVTTGALVVGAAVGAFVVAGGIVTVVLVVPAVVKPAGLVATGPEHLVAPAHGQRRNAV